MSGGHLVVFLALYAGVVEGARLAAIVATEGEKVQTIDVQQMRELWTELKSQFYDAVDIDDDQLDAINRKALQTAENSDSEADVYESTCVMCSIMCALQNCDDSGGLKLPAAPTMENRMEEFKQAAERCDIVLELDAGSRKPSEMFEDTFEVTSVEMSEEELETNKDAMFAEQSGRFEKCSELLDGEREAGTYRDNLHLCAERVMTMRKEHAETQRATGGMFPQRKYKDAPFMHGDCRYFTQRAAGGQPLKVEQPQYQLPAGWQAYSRARSDGAPYVEFMHAEHCKLWQGYPKFYPFCRASSVQSAWYKAQQYEHYKLQQARLQQNQHQQQNVCPADRCSECLRQGARFCNPARDVNPCRLEAAGRADYTDCMAHASLLEDSSGMDMNATATLADDEDVNATALAIWPSSSALVQMSQQGIFRTRRPWEPGFLFELFFGIISGCARFVHWAVTLPLKLFPSVFRAIINGFVGFKNFWLQGVGYTSDNLRVWPWCWSVTNGRGSLYNHRVCR